MKKSKLKLVTKILAIIIVCLISFVGIYVQNTNRMENVVKDFKFTKDLKGYRQIVLEVSDAYQVVDSDGKFVGSTDEYSDENIESYQYTKTDTPINKEEDLNVDNYELAKSVIENRLEDFGVKDYNISLDKNTGKIYMQIPEDSDTDRVVSNIKEKGSVELRDADTDEVLISSERVKEAGTVYNTTTSGTTVYLQIQFDKEGTEKLKELTSGDYATIKEDEEDSEEESNEDENSNEAENSDTSENTDEAENSDTSENTDEAENSDTSENTDEAENTDETEKAKQKEIALYMSGSKVTTTSFDEPIEDGKIHLSMSGASTDTDTINNYVQSASTISVLLNNGVMPLTYNVQENQYVTTDISINNIQIATIVIAVIMAILLVYMCIKYKGRGILSAISFIGFVAWYLLAIRYFNVEVALEGIISIVLVMLLNYLFNMKLLTVSPENKKEYYDMYKQGTIKMIPILAISIIFSLVSWTVLNSFGMCMFWGIVLILAYNILITKNIVD